VAQTSRMKLHLKLLMSVRDSMTRKLNTV
jgi:hypothetical protein